MGEGEDQEKMSEVKIFADHANRWKENVAKEREIYFAKFNINSDIYEVYAKQTSIEELLNQIVKSLSDKKSIVLEPYEDDTGEIIQNTIYFFSLDFQLDRNFVFGRIARTKEILRETSSRVTFPRVTFPRVASLSIDLSDFYFDLNKEIIAFIAIGEIGCKQFITYFKMLVEKCVPDIEIELFLENNIDELLAQVNKLQVVSKVTVTLIPPNASNDDELNDLFGCSAKDMKDAGITKIIQTVIGSLKRKVKTGIDTSSEWFSRLVKFGVGRGYGTIYVEGKDETGAARTIKSDEQALFKCPLPYKYSTEDFKERSCTGIVELMNQKSKVTKDERKDE